MTKGFREEKVTFAIVDFMGLIGKVDNMGFQKECNIVAWCGKPAKIDIRSWNADHTQCRKGVSLTDEEAEELYKILKARFE
jgi:hypothetical protein